MSEHSLNVPPHHRHLAGKALPAVALTLALALAGCSDGSDNPVVDPEPPIPPAPLVDRAWYILPPGNFGGLPTNENSLDQLPLYDGLTPLRGNVTDADIEQFFLPENFQPVGDTREEVTGRQGLSILYDSFGVPHITGDTRADVAFGAGWVTAPCC